MGKRATGGRVLSYDKDWETIIWMADGRILEDPYAVSEVVVRGKRFPIEWEPRTVYYNDHGHTYPATSVHGYVRDDGTLGARVPLKELLDRRFKVRIAD
jgi:hypothetical protein